MLLLKNKRVFIVEDNAGNLGIASIYLEQQGALVKFVRWGLDAVENIARAMPLDIILMDLMLPGKVSGYDVFQQLRQFPSLAGVPVVAISASDPDVAMRRTAEMGFAGFVCKPISARISQHVADVLAGKKVWIGDFGAFDRSNSSIGEIR